MDKNDRPDFDWDNTLNLDDICWDNFSSKIYHPFWRDTERAKQFLGFKKSYNNCKKPESFKQNRKPLCSDFIATGCIIGAWEHPKDGIEILGRYWEFLDSKMSTDSSAVAQYIRAYCDASDSGEGVKSSDLKTFLDLKVGNGSLLAKPRADEVKGIMQSLGYAVKLNTWKKA